MNSATLPNNQTKAIVVQVTNSATLGNLTYTAAAGTSAIGGSSITLQIAGVNGTQQLTFAGSSSLSEIATAINGITAETGVTASASEWPDRFQGFRLRIDQLRQRFVGHRSVYRHRRT